MGDVTEKKEGLQMDRQGKSGEGVLPTGVVKAICISDVRGIEKRAIEEGHFLVDFGIEGMPMAETGTARSAASYDKVKAFNERGADVGDGAFGENLVVEAWTSVPCRWHKAVRGNRGTCDDPDREGMPQPLCHL